MLPKFREYLPYYKTITKLAIPVIISQVGGMTVSLADTIMVGRLGAKPLASVAFANSLSWVIFLFGMGLAMGLTPLVGRAFARHDNSRMGSLLRNSLILNLLMGIVFTFVITGLSLAMPLMGQDPDIIPDAQAYLFFQILSAIPIMLYSTGKQFLEGMGNTFHAMWIMITANLMNIGLNTLLIFGYWGFPEMGPAGAGASTFISRIYMVVMFVWIFYMKAEYRIHLRNAIKTTYSKFRMRRLVNVGLPIGGQLSVEMLAMSVMALVIGTFSASALAGHNVAIQIPSTSFMVVTGLASATTILVSQSYGLRMFSNIRMTLKASLHLVTGYMIFSAIIILSFADQIASILHSDPEVISVAVQLLFIGAMFQISDGIQGITLGALRGLMEVKKPMYYAGFVYIFIGAPLGYLLSFPLGLRPSGPWITFTICLTILCFLYLHQFRKSMRKLGQ